jgi:predicted MPP superfamily phosphohydrolase
LLLYGSPALALGDGFGFEPRCLRTRTLRSPRPSSIRFAYFTDVHFKGDPTLLEAVVARLNRARPAFALFGGDLVEEAHHLPEALAILERLEIPLFGVPGNHDYWSGADFAEIDRSFRRTGGQWLVDAAAVCTGHQILGYSCTGETRLLPDSSHPAIGLVHYPAWADRLPPGFDMVLAGHSHGGQVRLPFIGALVKPSGVGRYVRGRFSTAAGPLFVSSGVGTFHLNVRFLCPPELVLIES